MLLIISLHTDKWLQVSLFDVINSIYQLFLSNTKNVYTAVWFNITSHHHHHHHHVVPLARISLTLSRHFSLSFIASGRSSGLHPVSSQSCCMYVLAGRPALARPYMGVHCSTSLMSSSLFLQQGPSSFDSFRDGRQVAV